MKKRIWIKLVFTMTSFLASIFLLSTIGFIIAYVSSPKIETPVQNNSFYSKDALENSIKKSQIFLRLSKINYKYDTQSNSYIPFGKIEFNYMNAYILDNSTNETYILSPYYVIKNGDIYDESNINFSLYEYEKIEYTNILSINKSVIDWIDLDGLTINNISNIPYQWSYQILSKENYVNNCNSFFIFRIDQKLNPDFQIEYNKFYLNIQNHYQNSKTGNYVYYLSRFYLDNDILKYDFSPIFFNKKIDQNKNLVKRFFKNKWFLNNGNRNIQDIEIHGDSYLTQSNLMEIGSPGALVFDQNSSLQSILLNENINNEYVFAEIRVK